MAKRPKADLPAEGDRVRLKGRGMGGVLRRVSPSQWAHVDWDEGVRGPKICHLYELECESDGK